MAAWDVVSRAAAPVPEFEDRWAPVAEEVAQNPWKPVAQMPAKSQGRGILQALKDYPEHFVKTLLETPQRAIEASEGLRTTGELSSEGAGDVMGGALLGGVKFAKKVGGVRAHPSDAVSEAPKVEPVVPTAEWKPVSQEPIRPETAEPPHPGDPPSPWSFKDDNAYNTANRAYNEANRLRGEWEIAQRKKEAANPIEFNDTRNAGQQYHGSPNPGLEVDQWHSASKNYYGSGFYTTDAMDVAHGYTKRKGRAGEGGIYEVTPGREIKTLNMEEPIPDWMKKAIPDDGSIFSDYIHSAIEGELEGRPPKNVRELYDDLRNNSAGEGFSADTVQEMFDMLRYHAEQEGYGAMEHVGGLQTKKAPHRVVIYFDSAEVKINAVDRKGFVKTSVPVEVPKTEPAASPPIAEETALTHPEPTPQQMSSAKPEPKTSQGLADDLQVLRQSSVADRAEVGNVIKALPEAARAPALGERLYHAAEDPAELAKLTPEERALYDQHLQPLRDEQAALAKRAKELGGADLVDDPNYIHRIAKGHAPAYDSLSGDAYDPVAGTRGLPRSTSAMQQRKYFVIENEAGVRKVVSASPDGLTVWNDKKGTNIAGNHELVPGGEVELNGKPWEVKQARTSEIEQHTNTEYHKNAFVNTADAVVRLREVVRNLEFVEAVKSSDWWMDHAVKAGGNREVPKGWVQPKMPQFSDWYVDPKYAHVLDDFYKPGYLDAESSLRKANQFATSSMFWNPIGHMQNVGVHWAVARGWDWLRPGPWRHFATDMTRALKETVTQGPEYQKWLREGGGLVYGGVKNADFYGDIGRQLGMDIEKNWGQYKPMFDKLGLKTPYEATAWWYSKMRNVLWATSDMFMMHRYLELERKGLPVKKALHEAEKHIPNYRIPTTIMGSREFSKIMQEPAFTVFSRYHYGMWRSFMNMAIDVAKGTPKEKFEALGNIAALAAMGFLVYPVVDAIYQKITNDQKAKMLARGAMSVPRAVKEWWHGDISFSQFLGNQITVAPATKELLQQFFGTDFFTRKPVEGVVPRAAHAARGLLSPYGTVNQTASGGRSTGRAILDTIVGGQNTSEKTTAGKAYAKRMREKDARAHELRPKDLIEQGYYGAKKYVTKKLREYQGPR